MTPGAGIVDSLRRGLPCRRRRILRHESRAAVLVPIIPEDAGERLLLTRRTDDMPTHRGQVAFPGGFCTPEENDPIATALREAAEEIGLPASCVEVLGLLDDFPTRTGTTVVTPVVGVLTELPRLEPQSGEVARIFTIHVPDLIDASRWSRRVIPGGGRRRWTCYRTPDREVLWGLSARIVLHMLALTPWGSPVAPD